MVLTNVGLHAISKQNLIKLCKTNPADHWLSNDHGGTMVQSQRIKKFLKNAGYEEVAVHELSDGEFNFSVRAWSPNGGYRYDDFNVDGDILKIHWSRGMTKEYTFNTLEEMLLLVASELYPPRKTKDGTPALICDIKKLLKDNNFDFNVDFTTHPHSGSPYYNYIVDTIQGKKYFSVWLSDEGDWHFVSYKDSMKDFQEVLETECCWDEHEYLNIKADENDILKLILRELK